MLDCHLSLLHRLIDKDEAGMITASEKSQLKSLMNQWEEEQERHPQNLSCFMGEEQTTVGVQTDVNGGL